MWARLHALKATAPESWKEPKVLMSRNGVGRLEDRLTRRAVRPWRLYGLGARQPEHLPCAEAFHLLRFDLPRRRVLPKTLAPRGPFRPNASVSDGDQAIDRPAASLFRQRNDRGSSFARTAPGQNRCLSASCFRNAIPVPARRKARIPMASCRLFALPGQESRTGYAQRHTQSQRSVHSGGPRGADSGTEHDHTKAARRQARAQRLPKDRSSTARNLIDLFVRVKRALQPLLQKQPI